MEPEEDVDIDNIKGTLFKRKDFLGIEEEGRSWRGSLTTG